MTCKISRGNDGRMNSGSLFACRSYQRLCFQLGETQDAEFRGRGPDSVWLFYERNHRAAIGSALPAQRARFEVLDDVVMI